VNPAKSPSASDAVREIATVRIELLQTKPLIWREVEVPTSITLAVLHEIVQIAIGWFDQHLWEFTIGKATYGPPDENDWGTESHADKVFLCDVLKPKKTVILYQYDFGDSWGHRLTITDIRAAEPDISYPRYVAGEGKGPPEDCGGIPGFYAMLKVLANPRHPQHAEIKEWAGDFDPKRVNEPAIRSAFLHIAKRLDPGRSPQSSEAQSA